MNFFYFESLDSTQTWLIEKIKQEDLSFPSCVMSDIQTRGIGSRNNAWENVENALMFSFCFADTKLPQDLPRQSISIYLGYLLKEWLVSEGHDVWLKWPNDLYVEDSKIGGIISQSMKNAIICGVGINLYSTSYASLKLNWNKIKKQNKLKKFLDFFFKFPTWSYVFEKYKLEFHKNADFTFHIKNKEVPFSDAVLSKDGSLLWKNQRIYSLR